MNSCHSSLEAMKFKGLPFHSVLGLKYKEKLEGEGARRWEEGREEIETTDGAQRRKVDCGLRRGSLKPLLFILTFEIDLLKMAANQPLHGSRPL